MSYEAKGKIVKIYEKESFSEKFEKREFVVETSEDYPQFIKFMLSNKTIPLLDEYVEGDDVIVNFNVKGKAGKDGRYWNSLEAWRLRKTKDVPEENEEQKKPKGKKSTSVKKKETVSEVSFENPSKDDDEMPF